MNCVVTFTICIYFSMLSFCPNLQCIARESWSAFFIRLLTKETGNLSETDESSVAFILCTSFLIKKWLFEAWAEWIEDCECLWVFFMRNIYFYTITMFTKDKYEYECIYKCILFMYINVYVCEYVCVSVTWRDKYFNFKYAFDFDHELFIY